MALIDDVRIGLERLAPQGWRELLLHHGLDISAADLEQELLRELPGIDRRVAGFEDFASEGSRGIEPGQPAHSLLYHALASPNVLVGAGGEPLGAFPTLWEIEAVENYVFGVEPPSVADLVARFPHAAIAVAVFATEYRPGAETVHRRHADLCFSRTGVARVGTAEPLYDAKARGFVPFVDSDQRAFRVLPARYAPYVAVLLKGEESLFGPMDFKVLGTPGGPDSDRDFWVPLHKLFAGTECMRDLDLSVALETRHVNEKIRRIHLHLAEVDGTGQDEQDTSQPPFLFTEGIAEFSTDTEFGEGVLRPMKHERLVEPAVYEGEPLTFEVPPNPQHNLGPSMLIPSEEDGSRRAPEFVHVRHRVDSGGTIHDLNDEEVDVVTRVREGGYRARHYVDFTGDGWVNPVCPQLGVQLPRTVPAYSTVTAPDFYPGCEQRELFEWWNTRVPSALRGRIWSVPPLPLSDERLAPNLQLEGSDFRPEDKTVTAIVSLPTTGRSARRPLNVTSETRHTHLPDGAAGVFAPGWDTSKDKTGGVEHLAAYGLGSPFPEDAKLCAALSAFWPAVAPDVSRSFSQARRTVTPMTDEEIGSVGDLPWDGIPGPHLVTGTGEIYEYASFDHVDYVNSALDGRFSLALTGRVNLAEYSARILAIARAYTALRTLGVERLEEEGWRIVSFRSADIEDEELQQAATETGTDLGSAWYSMTLVRHDGVNKSQDDHRKVRLQALETMEVFSGALPRVLIKQEDGVWRAVPTS